MESVRSLANFASPWELLQMERAEFEHACWVHDVDLTCSWGKLHGGELTAACLCGVRGQRGWLGLISPSAPEGRGRLPACLTCPTARQANEDGLSDLPDGEAGKAGRPARVKGQGWFPPSSPQPPAPPEIKGRKGGEQEEVYDLLDAVLQAARSAPLQTLTVEIPANNEPVLDSFQEAGFEVQRELLSWERPARAGALPIPYQLLRPADSRPQVEASYAWHDQPPAWGRELPALCRRAEGGALTFVVASDNDPASPPVGYCLTHPPENGHLRILDLAVAPQAGARSAGRALLQALHLKFHDVTATLPLEPVDSALSRVFAALGYRVAQRHLELQLEWG